MSNGDDIYYVDGSEDIVSEQPNGGRDRVYSTIYYTLPPNVEELVLYGSEFFMRGTGNELDNLIVGSNQINALEGLGGNDALYGGPDVDRLEGGSGTNLMVGGKGDDQYYVMSSTDILIERPGEGKDSVLSWVSHALAANIERLTLMPGAIRGVGNTLDNEISGNVLDNQLYGGDGNDTLVGNIGTDLLVGGNGDDHYAVDEYDTVVELADGGHDEIYAFSSYALPGHVEDLRLIGGGYLNGVGNWLDNYIFGNSGRNTLYGGDGDDRLDGNTGADILVGGTGDDSYWVDIYQDVIIEFAGEGHDTVHSTVSHELQAHVEDLVLLGSLNLKGYGNALDNVLTGNAGNNLLEGGEGNDTLDGGEGYDTLIGGAGNDIYYVTSGWTGSEIREDIVMESADGGYDTAYTRDWWHMADNIEEGFVILTPGSNDVPTLYGNGSDNIMHIIAPDGQYNYSGGLMGQNGDDTLYGSAQADGLYGEDGADIIYGGAGDDVIGDGEGDDIVEAGAGADLMSMHGGGNDRFIYRSIEDADGDAFWWTGQDADISGDVIDLSAIDASTVDPGNNAFIFLGLDTPFSQTAGELVIRTSDPGPNYDPPETSPFEILGDVDGDGLADFRIAINISTLDASNFIL